MKWLSIIFLLSVSSLTQAQRIKKYNLKIDSVNRKALSPITPFKEFNKDSFCQILISDSTMLMRVATCLDTAIKNKYLYQNFRILNKSDNGLRFLVYSDEHDRYAGLGIKNGYSVLYRIDIINRRILISVGNVNLRHYYDNKIIDTISKFPLLIHGNIKN